MMTTMSSISVKPADEGPAGLLRWPAKRLLRLMTCRLVRIKLLSLLREKMRLFFDISQSAEVLTGSIATELRAGYGNDAGKRQTDGIARSWDFSLECAFFQAAHIVFI